ncbi:MAG TPA: hypothetical protein VF587_14110 [Solirubrobacteraceae bacterium]
MRKFNRPVASLLALSAMGVAAVSPSALAGGESYPPPPTTTKAKCNAGNGNGSEYVTGGHCTNGDPGNSWNAPNRGGDEISFYPGSVPNPGGNNAP